MKMVINLESPLIIEEKAYLREETEGSEFWSLADLGCRFADS